MEIIEAIKSRYAEREYTNEPVTKEQIGVLLAAAHEAPCSCNLQLMHYVVVDDSSLREKLSHVATHKMMWAPTNIFFFIDPRFTVKRHSAIMGLGAAMQNMSLAATSMGLATCPMAGFFGDSKIKEILGVPKYLEAILILGVGHPKEDAKTKKRQRISLDSITHYNKFDDQVAKFINESDRLGDWTIEELIDYRRRIGPVYRYGTRFQLHVYSSQAYEKAAQVLVSKLDVKRRKMLDLFSYDCYFVEKLRAKGSEAIISVSDYFSDVTAQISELYPEIGFVPVDKNNNIQLGDESLDLVTAVEKLQFTPNLENLVKDVHRVLKREGYFFVTFEKKPLPKRIFHFFKKLLKRYATSSRVNVYENNPYYKIGPHREIGVGALKHVCRSHGMELVEIGTEDFESRSKFRSEFIYAIFRKK